MSLARGVTLQLGARQVGRSSACQLSLLWQLAARVSNGQLKLLGARCLSIAA